MKHFFSIIALFLACLMVSCNKSSTSSSTPSDVAQLSTFSFAPNDSFPGLKAARFTIRELADTGFVYNEDSILYGTSLRRVVPKLTFAATPSSVMMFVPDSAGTGRDTIVLRGNDTINFERQPIYLSILSQDGSRRRFYRLEAYVHQIDPDLYTWTQLSDSICPSDYEQQVLPLSNSFVCFASNGLETLAFISETGELWSPLTVDLPAVCHVRSIVSDGDMLYYVDANTLYTSADGAHWTVTPAPLSGCTLLSVLMSFNDLVWMVAEDDEQQLWLATYVQGTVSRTDIRLSNAFPIGGFAAVTFPASNGRAHAMILGGYSREGESLNSRWSFEYSAVEDIYRVRDFTIEQPNFTSLTGASMVWYDDKIFLFGGIDSEGLYRTSSAFYSLDEGMNWQTPDSAKWNAPAAYGIRQKQSAIVRDNYIYLFGGESRDYYYSDAYRTRLNSIDWTKK